MVSEEVRNKISEILSPDLKECLDDIKLNVETNDLDAVIMVAGQERTGKSNLMLQIMCYLDPKFEVKNVLFDRQEFNDFVSSAEKNASVQCDEAGNMFYKRNFAEEEQKETNKNLMKIGIKNLFMGMVLPDVADIDSHIRSWRARFLIRTEFKFNKETRLFERGFFTFYGWDSIKKIHKSPSNNVTLYPKPDGIGYFYKFPDNDLWEQYKQRKIEYVNKQESDPTKEEALFNKVVRLCKRNPDLWEKFPYIKNLRDDMNNYRTAMLWNKFDLEKVIEKYNFLFNEYQKLNKELSEIKAEKEKLINPIS